MAKRQFQVARTSVLDELFLVDATSSTGAGKTGLTATTGQLVTPTQNGTSTLTTGGSLVAATYYYRVSATTASGETLAFAEISQVVPAGTSTNTVTINWLQVSGATGYKVYGRTAAGELLIASVSGGSTLTYTDLGSITPSGALPTVNTTGIQIRYKRRDQNTFTVVQPQAMTIGTWLSGGLVELDAINAPGMYQIGIPNAALASSEATILDLWGAVGVALEVVAEYELVAYNPLDAVRLGLSALPTAALNTAGGARSAIIASGTAQSGTSTTIVLTAGDAGTAAAYAGALIQITGGTGTGQTRTISAYNAGTKTVTLATGRTFGVTPDATSTYIVVADAHPALNDALQVVASSVAGNVAGTTGDLATITPLSTRALLALPAAAPNTNGGVATIGETGALLDSTDIAAIWAATTRTLTSGGGTPPTVNQIAAAILATPANLLATDSSGRVTATPASVTSALLAAYTQSGSSSVTGNIVTFTSPDTLHTGTMTFSPSIAAPTSAAWVQVS